MQSTIMSSSQNPQLARDIPVQEVYTIKEIAEIANMSTQAVYQRLKKDLKPFLRYENGMKVLKAEAIRLLNREQYVAITQQTDKDIELLQSTIETLSSQLSTKDEQILILQGELKRQNEHARAQNDKLITLVEQVNMLQRNNQVLLKTEQDRSGISSEPYEYYSAETTSKPPRKRNWFLRLLGFC